MLCWGYIHFHGAVRGNEQISELMLLEKNKTNDSSSRCSQNEMSLCSPLLLQIKWPVVLEEGEQQKESNAAPANDAFSTVLAIDKRMPKTMATRGNKCGNGGSLKILWQHKIRRKKNMKEGKHRWRVDFLVEGS